jgi:hypothetical protein
MADKKDKSEFGECTDVWDVCKTIQDVSDKRSYDRSLLNGFFNGDRPYTEEECEANQIDINVNWGHGKHVAVNGKQTLNNAVLFPELLFNCTSKGGKVDKRDEWSAAFTKNIHVPIKTGNSGKRHFFLIDQCNATICIHGIAPVYWPNDFNWLPRYVALEDLGIPTDTYSDFSNLRYFFVNLYLTPGELMEIAGGDKVDKGWDKGIIKDLLESQKGLYNETRPSTWRDQPEAMKEVFKQNKGWFYSDATPKIKLRAFYWMEVDEPNKWYRHILLRESVDVKGKKIGKEKFLYDGNDRVFADDLNQILNVQYGDSNLIAPFKYHSTRGMGVDLFAPLMTLNKLLCQLAQHTFEQMNMIFRIQDPADRDRLKEAVLSNFSFIPEGLSIVPQNERHQIDAGLVETVMAQMTQISSDSASSYVQQNDFSKQKELRQNEAQAIINKSNMMVASITEMIYVQKTFYYQELVRRFLLKNPADKEVKDFQEACRKDGIPDELMVASNWSVTPERVLGGGDSTLAQQQALWLLSIQQKYDPRAQQSILRLATSTMLKDWSRGNNLVPVAPVVATDGTYAAENVFGTLMQGTPCNLRQGIDQQGYIEQLLKFSAMVCMKIQKSDNVGTIDDLLGLQNVAQNIGQHIMILAGDEAQKQRVKVYSDDLGKIMNEAKGFIQRFTQKQQAQQEAQQGDPAAVAKAKGTILMAATKSKIAESNAQMKQRHKEIDFAMQQQQDKVRLMAEMDREGAKAHNEALLESMQMTAKLMQELRAMSMKEKAQKESE